MLILDLFSGTQSLKKVVDKLGWEYKSVDIEDKYKPTICVDILDWDYKKSGLKPDIIWASPPCITWSIATHRHRVLPDLKPKTEMARIAELLIKKMLEIIEFFKPKIWLIENPRGRLRHYGPMLQLENRKTFYYSNYKHYTHKPTDIWSSHYLGSDEKKPDIKLTKWSDLKGNRFQVRNAIPESLLFNILVTSIKTYYDY